jgi:hypothetical protein
LLNSCPDIHLKSDNVLLHLAAQSLTDRLLDDIDNLATKPGFLLIQCVLIGCLTNGINNVAGGPMTLHNLMQELWADSSCGGIDKVGSELHAPSGVLLADAFPGGIKNVDGMLRSLAI